MPNGERSSDEYLGRKVVFDGPEPVNIYDRLLGERQERAAERDARASASRREREARKRRRK